MPTAKWLNAASILLVLGAAGSRAGVLAQTHDAGADRQQLQGNVKAARTDDMPVQIVRPGRLKVTAGVRPGMTAQVEIMVNN